MQAVEKMRQRVTKDDRDTVRQSATLRGEVPNDTQRREVTQMVASLPGVQRVNDQLQLGNPAVFWKRSNSNY